MKKVWIDPVKAHSAKPSTLGIEGDFERFTDVMSKVIHDRPRKEARIATSSASPAPARS